jgi:hypothetical protein
MVQKYLFILKVLRKAGGPGLLNRYSDWLWAGRSGDRIPVVACFSAPVHTNPEVHPACYTMGTGSEVHPACYTMGTGSEVHPACYTMGTGSSPGVKRLGRCVDHPN